MTTPTRETDSGRVLITDVAKRLERLIEVQQALPGCNGRNPKLAMLSFESLMDDSLPRPPHVREAIFEKLRPDLPQSAIAEWKRCLASA